jgi:hypothetical protein
MPLPRIIEQEDRQHAVAEELQDLGISWAQGCRHCLEHLIQQLDDRRSRRLVGNCRTARYRSVARPMSRLAVVYLLAELLEQPPPKIGSFDRREV